MNSHDTNGRTRGTWIQQLKARDDSAWRTFLERYAAFIEALCQRHGIDNPEDRLDIQQEVLHTVCRFIGGYVHNPSKPSFRCWLAKIIHDRIFDQFRRTKRRPPMLTEEQRKRFADEAADGLEELMKQEERQHALAEIFRIARERVPPSKWAVFNMRYVEQLPVETVVQRLDYGLSTASVHVYVSQVLAVCREIAKDFQIDF